jgi:hypothetical protein
MIGVEERRRLINRLGGEFHSPLWTVLKCVMGIALIIAGVAGPWAVLTSTGPIAPGGGQAMAVPERALAPGVAESKRVFDERRQRYAKGHPEPAVAAQHSETGTQVDSYSDPGFQVRSVRY